ncbi:MAG: hypothetical protein ACK500_11920 [Flavobacteriales bacterium]|jgi:hypothetical protein
MKTPDQLADHARVWIYQSAQPLTPGQAEKACQMLNEFIADWTSHGARMEAAAGVYHGHFIVIAADEQKALASGCGIDKSVQAIRNISADTGMDFFDRLTVHYMNDGEVRTAPMNAFWALRKSEVVTGETRVFNNLVRTVGEWKKGWIVPFAQSWHQEAWGGPL